MVEAPITQTPDGAGLSQISWEPSELLTNYERLLKLCGDELRKDEFNPYQSIPRLFLKAFSWSYQRRFWKHTAAFSDIPNTLRQELAGGAMILQELERLNDQTLRAVAECNHINHRRLLKRSAVGLFSQSAVLFGAVLAAIRAIKEVLGIDISKPIADMLSAVLRTDITLATLATWFLVGLLLGSLLNFLALHPLLLLVRALDDLIAIAATHRGMPKPER